MKVTFSIIGLVVILIFLANTSIQFKPFKISFETPWLAIGMLLIFIGIGFIQVQPHSDAYKKGLKAGGEIAHEAAKEVARQMILESKNQ